MKFPNIINNILAGIVLKFNYKLYKDFNKNKKYTMIEQKKMVFSFKNSFHI